MNETKSLSISTGTVRLAVSAVFLLVFGTVFVLLLGGSLQPYKIDQNSMQPTLHPGDYVMTKRFDPDGPGPKRGDIVIIHNPLSSAENDFFVKRVVALPGDTFEIREGGALYINGQLVPEPYIEEPPTYWTPRPLHIKEGHYVVLGDNRNHSEDSSVWNESIDRDEIVSKVLFIYRPLNRFGPVH